MDDQQKPGPSGQKSGMPGNFDDILRYFNIVRDDHDESEIDEKPFDDQWENDGSGFLFEPNDDFNFNFNRCLTFLNQFFSFRIITGVNYKTKIIIKIETKTCFRF